MKINRRAGKDWTSADDAAYRFRIALNKSSTGSGRDHPYGVNMHGANLYVAIVVVDLIKASHNMRACGTVLFCMDTDDTNRGENELLSTCPYLDISRTVTGGELYTTPLEREMRARQKMERELSSAGA